MKTYDATEEAYKNGFAACAEFLRKFRPGDKVSVKTQWGAKTGVVTDWIPATTCPDVMYLVRVGTQDEFYAAAYKADELTLVERPFFESEEPPHAVSETVLEARGWERIPFVRLHQDDSDEDVMLRVDTIDTFTDGYVTTDTGASLCVKESAEEIMNVVQKAWDAR